MNFDIFFKFYWRLVRPSPRDDRGIRNDHGIRGSAVFTSSGSRMLSIMRDIRDVASLNGGTTEGQYDNDNVRHGWGEASLTHLWV